MGKVKELWQALAGWWKHHLLVRDGLLALFLTFLFTESTAAAVMADGIIFPASSETAMLFSFLLGLPLVFRRRWPEPAAQAFIAICIAQLLIGPGLIMCDVLGLVMLYSVLAYGRRDHSRRYVLTAITLTVLTALCNALSYDLGPLFHFTLLPGTRAFYAENNRGSCRLEPGNTVLNACGPSIAMRLVMYLIMYGLLLLLVIVLAFWNRSRKQALTAIRERNAAIEYQQQEQARLAASAERARIARDMHDVVAHTLSIVIVQSDAGRYAGATNPAVALDVMGTIRREASRALGDMDRLFGTFAEGGRESSPQGTVGERATSAQADSFKASTNTDLSTAHALPAAEPEPTCAAGAEEANTYSGIDDLVRQARLASPDLTLERSIEGTPEPGELGAQASLAVYRCVQESLSNIRKHAGPQAHALIREYWSADGLRLLVSDDGRGAAEQMENPNHQGYGLVGMRERLSAVGGQLTAGPQLGGGFCVDASIPFTTARTAGSLASGRGGLSPQGELSTAGTVNDINTGFSGESSPQVNPAHQVKLNKIERLARWSSQHYLAVDILLAVPFLLLMVLSNSTLLSVDTNVWPTRNTVPIGAIVAESIAIGLPLMFRRRLPNLSAALIAGVSAIELLTVPWISTVNILVLVSIYSAIAYGRGKTRLWVPLTILGGLALMFVRLRVEFEYSSPSILAFLLGDRGGSLAAIAGSPKENAAIVFIATAITCACAVLLGLWRRASGSSLILQKEREQALREGEARGQILAANAERARIGAQIQAEVTTTLSQVIDRADAGIAMIRSGQKSGDGPSAAAIDQAFEVIGREGRTALARMRRLLDILRQTGSSAASEEERQQEPALQLHPVQARQVSSARSPRSLATSAPVD
ncbi:sensor histidine kinase [Bombiscardovia nodaiensis]|uniref:histidine kinase n=1 Tax=Bombiscardovia nodaiensis TaxID=2932181 RepID=A0ABM8B846_9BIFI|nr:sensor histidine kinase [Bombiscardovia nodaiensis]